jgi:long-chain acyl-CoA synthetase
MTTTTKANRNPDPAPGVETIHDLLIHATRKYGPRRAFGMRRVLDTHTVDVAPESPSLSRRRGSGDSTTTPRLVEKLTLSQLEWMTYDETLQEVRRIGSGLRGLGAGDQGAPGFFAMCAGTR